MLKDLHVAHLTGTVTIYKNELFLDRGCVNRPPRTLGQIFFKPYESKKEFIFCARSTLQPLLIIGIGIFAPLAIIIPTIGLLAMSLGCLLISAVSECLGNKEAASLWFNAADELCSRLLQALINILVLPISAVVLITRSISTGLKAADIYDYDALQDDMPASPPLMT